MIHRSGRLIYRDNTCYKPEEMPMEGIGMYEGYTHMANLFLSKICDGYKQKGQENSIDSVDLNVELQDKIYTILDDDPDVDGGVTRLTSGDLVLRIFGYRAQKLQEIADKIKKEYEMLQN